MANVQWHGVQGDPIVDDIKIHVVMVNGHYAGWFNGEFDCYTPDGTRVANAVSAFECSRELHKQHDQRNDI